MTFEEALVLNPAIIEGCRYASHLVKWQKHFGPDHVLVCLYDDLRADEEKYLARICDFIEVPHVPPVKLDKVTINSFESPPKNAFLARLALKIRLALQHHEYYRTIDIIDRGGFFEFCRGRGERYPPVASDTAKRLSDQLRPEVEALEKLIDRDLSSWK
ncbi:MAG: sulfotransferase domain-containing protein [Acidobacteriaceae bacterium]